jgi:hypothetical protein
VFSKATALKEYTLSCLNGKIGKVRDFYLDDRFWAIRYLVVDMEDLLPGRQVLISPYAVVTLNRTKQTITLDITRNQIKQSPLLSNDEPVTREFEEACLQHYGWPKYWGDSGMSGFHSHFVHDKKKQRAFGRNRRQWEARLQSTHDLIGRSIRAVDGDIGPIVDCVIDEETWAIRYWIIDAGQLSPRRTALSPQWIDGPSWNEQKVFINLSCEIVRQSPEFTENSLLTSDFENGLRQYYSRHEYWIEEPFLGRHSH